MMSCACFLWGGRSCWNWVLVGVVCGLLGWCCIALGEVGGDLAVYVEMSLFG